MRPIPAFMSAPASAPRAGSFMPAAMSKMPPIRKANAPKRRRFGAMVSGGDTRIAEILVIGDSARLCTPCGGCRQRLSEFAGPQTPVHVCGPEGLRETIPLGDLLPYAFVADNLED